MPFDDLHSQSQPFTPAENQSARRKVAKSGVSKTEHDKVIAAFNTWAFKREQPSDLTLLGQVVSSAIAAQRPLEFILYWGKGPRPQIAKPDLDCLDYLVSLGRRVKAIHSPGVKFHLIFTDTHATLNGHAPTSMNGYFEAVEAAGRSRGFAGCRLGDIVQRQADIEASVPRPLAARPAHTLENLKRCAARWYRGTGESSEGAVAYYDMNMIEKRAVELQFPLAIFITFNGSTYRDLFPDQLPVFYMYSLRKGFGVKPWFLDEHGVAVASSDFPAGSTSDAPAIVGGSAA